MGNPSFPPSFSFSVGGDGDKSSRDVATHNRIHSPSSPPPPASTPDYWLFLAPTPTTPNILEGHDSPENTAHVFDIPHTSFIRLSTLAFREYQPRTPIRFHHPPCPPQPAREMATRMCPNPFARARIADSRWKKIPRAIRINATEWKVPGGACITSGLTGEEKNCHQLHRLLDRRGEKRMLAPG